MPASGVASKAGRTPGMFHAGAPTRRGAAQVASNGPALKAGQQPERPEGGVLPARAAAPFQAWTAEAARRVITAIAAAPAVRACHPAAVVAVRHRGAAVAAAGGEAGGSYENISITHAGIFKGEDGHASRDN
jgi:hypothetical protein